MFVLFKRFRAFRPARDDEARGVVGWERRRLIDAQFEEIGAPRDRVDERAWTSGRCDAAACGRVS